MPDAPRIGIAGAGSIGRRHGRAAERAGAEIVVLDPTPPADDDETRRWARADSLAELLGAGLDALIVASPDPFHAEQAIAAIERGVPVLVEKPLAATLADADAVAAVAAAHGTPVLVGYVLRHSATLRAAAQLLAAGAIGEPASFHVHLGAYETLVRARNRFAVAEHGALYRDYSHEWDYVQWLLGPIVRGLAAERTVAGLELVQEPNVVDGLLELADGVVGSFHLDYVQDPPARTFSLVGTEGTLAVDVPGGRVSVRGRGGAAPRELSFAQARDGLFDAQLRHLLRVAAGAEPPCVGVEDGRRALAVALALREAAAERAWVDVAVPSRTV